MVDKQFSLSHLSRPPLARPTGKAPGLILLHGFGSNEQDLMGLSAYLDPRLHILSARAPNTLGQGMYAWYNLQPAAGGDFLIDERQMRASVDLVDHFIGECIEEYDLDPKRLYMGGFSQGAIQSCAALLLTPEKVAGVVAMSGRWPEGIEVQRAPDDRLKGKPVLAVHGLYDTVIPIRFAHTLKKNFEALPVDFTYREFPMAHTVTEESLAVAIDWLARHLDQDEEKEADDPLPS